ncbi:MAG: 5-(carboxyamino)imidazole ribonucleotide mutase [Bacteroidales bacterium]|nr:5-(carboxyamino)imidazole ribonucleotide mutase [Bacteroidales bacterium]
MKVSVIMGSASDWEVMKPACDTLEQFGVPYEKKVLSAHRTPREFSDFIATARERGVGAVIAGAGGAAHLAGMAAAMTTLPVIGVPVRSKALNGLDSLLSMVQMPSGIPVATVAIDGAKNAALIAVSIFALTDADLADKLEAFRRAQAERVLASQI